MIYYVFKEQSAEFEEMVHKFANNASAKSAVLIYGKPSFLSFNGENLGYYRFFFCKWFFSLQIRHLLQNVSHSWPEMGSRLKVNSHIRFQLIITHSLKWSYY